MAQKILTKKEVLEKYSAGPDTGIFTDGGARPNPGRGGWGVVVVKDNKIYKELSGSEKHTTNNRMEYTALIEAMKLLQPQHEVTIYSDSNLCVQTLNLWAVSWEKNGWKKKSGEIKNLELVQEAFRLYQALPKVKLKWVKAHAGWKWNEYADALASEWLLGAS